MPGTSPGSVRVGEAALENFERGYNCAESVVMALAPTDGHAPADPQRAATALGGGIARAGLVCGCISGAAVAVGLRLGRVSADDTESKERAYRVVANIVRRFEGAFGTTECRKLTGLDFNRENPEEELDRVHAEVCTRLVRFAAEAAHGELTAVHAEMEQP